MDEDFLKAALPSRVVCLGLPLRDFCLGHALILQRQNNPLVVGGVAEMRHLVEAVSICSDTYEDALKIPTDRWLKLKLFIWFLLLRAPDFEKEKAVFLQYVSNGSVSPKIKPGDGRSMGSPFLLRLARFLTSVLGYTESEAWNHRLGLAHFEYATYYESTGEMKVENAEDREFSAWVAEQEAIEANKNKCQP